MKRIQRHLPAAAAIAVLFAGCSKDEAVPVDLGAGYFPTRVGHWVPASFQDFLTCACQSLKVLVM